MKKSPSIPSREIGALLERAEEHLEKSEYTQAEKLANDVLSLPNGSDSLPRDDEARAHCILGNCCSMTGRYDDALMHSHNALTAAEAASNLSLQSMALNVTAFVQNRQGEYNSALGIAEHALALAEKAEDKKQQSNSLNNIGTAHRILGDYPRSLDYFSRALAIAEEIGDKSVVARTLCNIGNVHYSLADYLRALDYNARSITLAEELGYKYCVATNLCSIGLIHAYLADYPRALSYCARALAIAEEIGDKQGVASILGNIGAVYNGLVDDPRSLDYQTRSLAIAEEIGNKNTVALNLGNIGNAYRNIGDYPRASEYFKRALELSEQIDARRTVGNSMDGIARVEWSLGNLDSAYQGFLDTLHHRRDVLKTNERVADTLLDLGSVLIEQGKTEEGLARLEEALALAEELGEKQTAAEAHKEIAGVYVKKGDVALELDHLKKHYAIEKEIFNEESKKSVDIFNMRVAIAEIEHGVEVQKLKVERMEHEITSQAIHLAAQTDLLDRFRNDLRHITREIDEPIAALKKIKEKLKELPCKSIDWTKFEAQFNQVHPEFKAKLAEKYPELTQMEQRIAAMVRMDLNSATIARLFCVTERAVEFHRLNLRKKLGLKEGEKLPKFLSML